MPVKNLLSVAKVGKIDRFLEVRHYLWTIHYLITNKF